MSDEARDIRDRIVRRADEHETHYFGDGHDHGPCPTCGDAALAAAPPVDGLVWCDGLEDVVRNYHTGGGVESHTAWLKRPCTATHRTVLLGPKKEVQA